MTRWMVVGSLIGALALSGCSQGPAERTDLERAPQTPTAGVDTPRATPAPADAPSASPPASASTTQTGGDRRPSAVDPAQASKTGANAGEGASYSRSTEKGASTVEDSRK